jgi:hypothetical protein
MDIKEALQVLREAGVVVRRQGDHATISRIPSWRVYLLADDFKRELAAIHVVKAVFRNPIDPIKYDPKVSDKCQFCIEYSHYKCLYKYKERIPATVAKDGCERFKLNTGVFF